jgi:hypothetical protein
MGFSVDEFKNDIATLDTYAVYQKYILSKYNWYFENILSCKLRSVADISANFTSIISNTFGVHSDNIIMVGSGKMGYSLTPVKENVEPKLFKSFCIDGRERKASDIDVAIISDSLFYQYWLLLRKSFKMRYSALYKYIPGAVYRGYI